MHIVFIFGIKSTCCFFIDSYAIKKKDEIERVAKANRWAVLDLHAIASFEGLNLCYLSFFFFFYILVFELLEQFCFKWCPSNGDMNKSIWVETWLLYIMLFYI